MPRKVHMSEGDIQQYEQLDVSAIAVSFSKVGLQKGAELFKSLLTSYRIAAQVANACWALVADLQQGAVQPETWERVTRSLGDYSPGNFPPPPDATEYTAHVLERLYAKCSEYPLNQGGQLAVLEQVFAEAERHQALLPRSG